MDKRHQTCNEYTNTNVENVLLLEKVSMKQAITNALLRLTALHLPFLRSQKNFTGDVVFSCNFNDREDFKNKFIIKNNEIYNTNPVLFLKEMVAFSPIGLVLSCKAQKGIYIHWDGTEREYTHVAGCITTWNGEDNKKFTHVGGTWIVKAKFPRTWAAVWLLHPDYYVPKISKNHIIPEIDLAECNNGIVDNVLHYGYHATRYSYKGMKHSVHKNDGKFHEYAITILKDGYDFYLDGILITKFRSNDTEFVAYNEPLYLILNNAVGNTYKDDYSEFIIQSVKVYK
jgi:hypothetical protein